MPVINFATQSYQHKSLPISAQRAVNCYAEAQPKDAKTPVALLGVPGLVTFAGVGSGPIRGMHMMNNMLFVVSGQFLYSVTSAGVVTALGGTITGNGYVPMADNGTQVCIVNGVNGYIWSATSGFQIISDPNFHPANSVIFFDNFFAFDFAGTNKWFISNSGDGTSFLGTDFASAEVSSDFVLSLLNQQEVMLIFGQRTIEQWQDVGALNFPFQRITAATIERGCAAALTPVKEDNSVFFLGDDLVYYRFDNNAQLTRKSTHAIEAKWQTYSTVADAYSFSYTFEGHKFIVVKFPTANATWVYDIATDLWHERESWDQNNNSYGTWRGTFAIEAFGLVLVGDQFSNNIGFLTSSVNTEFGNTIRMLASSPQLHDDRRRVFVSILEMDVESGVGAVTGQGSNPQIFLDYSRDGGRTFINYQQFNSLGALGQYLNRVRWFNLGQAFQWTFRIHISDPVRRTIVRAHAQTSLGEP
jgi:hypothetical protein